VHVTVIDGSDAQPLRNQTVVLRKEKISSIRADGDADVPAGTRTVDGTGKYLIPGLADMHIHLLGAGEPQGSREFVLPLLVANGITTVRDMGGDVAQLKRLRAEISSGKEIGPQIFFTGPYLDGDPPSFQPSILVQNSAQAYAAVHLLKAEEVNFIKVQSRLKPEAYFAIADAVKKEGMRFVGHVPDSISAAQASEAGQASIEHLTGVMLGCSSREDELRKLQLVQPAHKETARQTILRQRAWLQAVLDSYSEEKAHALYGKFLANHTWQVPTLPLLIDLVYLTPEHAHAADSKMKYVPPKVREFWRRGVLDAMSHKSAEDFAVRDQLVAAAFKEVREMHGLGIPMMAGTDSTAPNVFPGFSLHESMADLVEAGFTPMEALQAATSKPAEFLGRSQQQGRIATGQRADLVLLDEDPLKDIHNTEKIFAVVLNGRLLMRADLDGLLKKAEQFAARP